MAACGIPSLIVVLLLIPFPESPRYLLHANRAEQALQVLQRIFVVNTKLHEKDFPVSDTYGIFVFQESLFRRGFVVDVKVIAILSNES